MSGVVVLHTCNLKAPPLPAQSSISFGCRTQDPTHVFYGGCTLVPTPVQLHTFCIAASPKGHPIAPPLPHSPTPNMPGHFPDCQAGERCNGRDHATLSITPQGGAHWNDQSHPPHATTALQKDWQQVRNSPPAALHSPPALPQCPSTQHQQYNHHLAPPPA